MNRNFVSNIQYGQGLDMYAMRTLAKNEPEAFMRKAEKLIESGHIKLSKLGDIRALYQMLADITVPVQMPVAGVQRSMMASAFPILTGSLVIKAINERYAQIETVGQYLVEEIEDNKKVTTMAAVHALDKNIEEVKEGEEFPDVSATEEHIEIRHKRNGRKFSITAEMLEENNLADIMSRVNHLAEIASDWVEELTLERVTDHYGCAASPAEPYVYRPNGTGTTLFSATANTPGTRAPSGNRVTNNALVDETDLEAARVRLSTMLNSRGKRIAIPRSEIIVLVPDALVGTALKLFNSEYVPGVENERSNWGPGGKWNIPGERIVSTPKLDDYSTAAWYMGAFRRQFIRKWKLRFEYTTLGANTQAYLNSRISFQARIGWDCEVGARDYVYVVQCLSGTTAPYDD